MKNIDEEIELQTCFPKFELCSKLCVLQESYGARCKLAFLATPCRGPQLSTSEIVGVERLLVDLRTSALSVRMDGSKSTAKFAVSGLLSARLVIQAALEV